MMLKQVTKYMVLFLISLFVGGWTTNTDEAVKVYIFLGEKCVISQYYTLPLRQMHREFASDKIEFIGVFSNPDASQSGINSFKEKYQLLLLAFVHCSI